MEKMIFDWLFTAQVAKALVMAESPEMKSVKLTILFCLYLTYLLSGANVRSPSEGGCLSDLSSY